MTLDTIKFVKTIPKPVEAQKMKKLLFIISFVIGNVWYATTQNVHIPDPNFKTYLLGNLEINTNSDTEIQVSEAFTFAGGIICDNMDISDLTGIEAFVNITALSCMFNQLTTLDVSQNTALYILNCDFNQLTFLDVSKNVALEQLDCVENYLMSLDVSQNAALRWLQCWGNQLTSMDVKQCPDLLDLYCWNNQLTTLDVSQNAALQWLSCKDNQLTTLDLSQNSALHVLSCERNQLTTLNVSQNDALSGLNCQGNLLTTLEVGTGLVVLDCSDNQLKSLNVSQNPFLQSLDCGTNQLTSLNANMNRVLNSLVCDNNQLTSLNVANENNVNFNHFSAINNPDLFCIEVDDKEYSDNSPDFHKDSIAIYSEDCIETSRKERYFDSQLIVYPNPASHVLTIQTVYNVKGYRLINIYGQTIKTANMNGTNINIAGTTPGPYTLLIETVEGYTASKIIFVE